MPRPLLILVALAALAPAAAQAAAQRVFIASDSTAAIYGPESYPRMGWGMLLPCALPSIEVLDLARGGRSSRTFIEQGFLADLSDRLRPGDVMLIQFGHNDHDVTDPRKFVEPTRDFPRYLSMYLAAAREKGATPVLVTPIARRRFKDGRPVDVHGPYAEAVRELARRTRTPLIDLDAASRAALAQLGPDGSRAYYVPDDIHLTERGARLAAQLVAQGLAALGLPSPDVRAAAISQDVHGSASCR